MQALQEMGTEFVRSNVVNPILIVPHGNPNVVVTVRNYFKLNVFSKSDIILRSSLIVIREHMLMI